ncbi:uncharacterized protein LOC132746169 [Ruditapes philippinarum]|nr:uncharacterized protein LOC132746169 [Ruditapes philippinarum]
MDVIGRASENIVGVPGSSKNDTSLIMLERLARETAQTKTTEENEIITEFVFPDNFTDSNELLEVPLHTTTKRSMTSISCIKCQCPECKHTRQLKKKKLELQIKYFSKIEQ